MNSKNLIFIILFFFNCYQSSMDSFIMMPFKTFDNKGNLINLSTLQGWLSIIKNSGFKGITIDFWWGLIESSPKQYNFSGYIQLTEQVKAMDLKLKVILSFHSCGSTIGDNCDFPLPAWVLDSGDHLFYRDQYNQINHEYISIFADDLKLSDERSVLQVYEDFITQFNENFKLYYGNVIVNIELGVGPAGQLHYPSYSYSDGFCGIGLFQWYGPVAQNNFRAFLSQISIKNDESNSLTQYADLHPPTLKKVSFKPNQEYFFNELNLDSEKCRIPKNKVDCGHKETKQNECLESGCCWQVKPGDPYCFHPRPVYNYKADLGTVYMQWYQEQQLKHLQRILTIGRKVLGFGVPISVKLPCVHWLVKEPSRAAERTAGFMANLGEAREFEVNGESE